MKSEMKSNRWFTMATIIVFCMTMFFSLVGGNASAADLVVFAAASTTNAITDIGKLYAEKTETVIKPSFASSSTLAKQIASGAPADVYLSANKKWMDFLEKKNAVVKESRFDLLGNRIVLIVPQNSDLKEIAISPDLALAELLGKDGRLSMGDPDHVPAGMYGKKGMENLGLWPQVKDRLAPMKDVRAALVLVEREEAPLGQVYATDAAISKKVRVAGKFPENSHPPIVYPVAAVSGGNTDGASQFLEFLKSADAGSVFEKYGFEVR